MGCRQERFGKIEQKPLAENFALCGRIAALEEILDFEKGLAIHLAYK